MKYYSTYRITEIQAELMRRGYDAIYLASVTLYAEPYIFFVKACVRANRAKTFIKGYIPMRSLDECGVEYAINAIEKLCGRR